MKTLKNVVVITLLACLCTGCDLLTPETKVTIEPAQLVGRWETPSQSLDAKNGDRLVFVFQTDTCIMEGYTGGGHWGYQFDEGDDVHEADVLAVKHADDHWFGYVVDGKYIHLFSCSAMGSYSGYSQSNIVSSFSSTQMTMQDGGKTYTFTKTANQ